MGSTTLMILQITIFLNLLVSLSSLVYLLVVTKRMSQLYEIASQEYISEYWSKIRSKTRHGDNFALAQRLHNITSNKPISNEQIAMENREMS